ncbi:MAG: hypothetical protein ABI171_15695, partial [Collimonas sp.]|uniref:hypothetical protein n=1 Tax=Collimonas sp. TaxID=1963772 RepID=UPI003267DF24
MNQRFPFLFRLLPIALIGMSALSAHAAGPLAIPNGVIQSNAAAAGTSFNSLSAEDRKKLLAAPESDLPSNAAGGGMNLNNDRHCIELQQQINRAQTAAPASLPDSYAQRIARNDPGRP